MILNYNLSEPVKCKIIALFYNIKKSLAENDKLMALRKKRLLLCLKHHKPTTTYITQTAGLPRKAETTLVGIILQELQTEWWKFNGPFKASEGSIAWNKLDRNAVDAVAFIRRSFEPLAFENMAQVPSTGCTCDLSSSPIRIRLKKKKKRKWLSIHYHTNLLKRNLFEENSMNKQRKPTERFIAPGRPSKNAGQPQPELNLVTDL